MTKVNKEVDKPQPRKINFDVVPVMIGGQNVTLRTGADGKPIDATLGEICIFCLNFSDQMEDRSITGEQKYSFYKLGRKLEPGGEIALQAQEIVLIKQRAAKALTAYGYGAVCDLIDPAPSE